MTDTTKVFSVSELKTKLEEETGLELDNSFKVKKEEEKFCADCDNPHKCEDCVKEEKEEVFDYGEDDEWVWGYSAAPPQTPRFASLNPTEYVINISGGGDGVSPNGFEDWVIKKVGGKLKYYIRHGGDIPDKEQTEKGFEKLFSCPEGNYVSFQATDYKPREGEMDFEWLEDELEETDERMITQIDNLSRANKFLQKITDEQTKKIEELKKENGEIMDSLDTAVSNKTRALEEENKELKEELDVWVNPKGEVVMNREGVMVYEKAQEEIEELKKENKALKEIIIGLKPQGTYLLSAEAEIKKLQEEIKKLKATRDSLNNSGMETAHEYELLSDKTANDNETFIGVISDLESQVKKLESQVSALESDKHNLMCVIREKNIDWKKVLEEMENDCRPDTWDCM